MNKDNPLGLHMPNAICLKKYWGLYHKRQMEENFYGFKKVNQSLLHNLFDDDKCFGTGFKRKYLLSNQPDQDNGDGNDEKNYHRYQEKHTYLYFLGHQFYPFITEERLHEIHHHNDH